MVHPRDADAWRTAFVDVEGSGRATSGVSSRRDLTSNLLLGITRPEDGREPARHPGISLVDLQVRAGIVSENQRFRQLSILSFGHGLVVRYGSLTELGITCKERLPSACLAVLVVGA